MPVSRELE